MNTTKQITAADAIALSYEVLSLLAVCETALEAMSNDPGSAGNLAFDVRTSLKVVSTKLDDVLEMLEMDEKAKDRKSEAA